jgi:acyl dehydratase
MGFTMADLISHKFTESRQEYSARETILYALGLGVGADPTDPAQLKFVYEKGLCALPTMGVVLAHPGFWAGDPALGVDWVKMLHVGQGLTVYRPIPVEGTLIGRQRVADVIDRGASKGALLYYEREVYAERTGEHIATVRQTLLCRGNGGFGGEERAAPASHTVPDRAPDHVAVRQTLPQAALIYRLAGDLNPLHADPEVAAKAGFPRPILHGLATYGVAALAVLETYCGGDPARFASFDTRFTAPVFPGETLRTELWRDGEIVSLRSTVVDRDVVALDGGRIEIRAD